MTFRLDHEEWMTWTAFLGWLFAAYVLLTGIYIALENRRPQATLAWMLVLLSFFGLGLPVHVLFGGDRKAFAKQSKLLRQDLEANAKPLVSPILSRQDAEIARLEDESASRKKLMMLVRRNPQSALTRRNVVEILQNGENFYPRMIKDMNAAQHSIHLQSSGISRTAASLTRESTEKARRLFGGEIPLQGSSRPCCDGPLAKAHRGFAWRDIASVAEEAVPIPGRRSYA